MGYLINNETQDLTLTEQGKSLPEVKRLIGCVGLETALTLISFLELYYNLNSPFANILIEADKRLEIISSLFRMPVKEIPATTKDGKPKSSKKVKDESPIGMFLDGETTAEFRELREKFIVCSKSKEEQLYIKHGKTLSDLMTWFSNFDMGSYDNVSDALKVAKEMPDILEKNSKLSETFYKKAFDKNKSEKIVGGQTPHLFEDQE